MFHSDSAPGVLKPLPAVLTVQSQQFVAASFISVSFSSSYLSLLPILSPVCQLFAARTFHVGGSHLHHQWLLNHKILKVSNNRDSHLRAAMFKKSELGLNKHMILYSVILNFNKALV